MPQSDKPYTFDRVVRMIVSIVTVLLLLWLVRYLSSVLIPFAVAVVLAYLINPVVEAFSERFGRRDLAVGVTLTALVVVGLSLGVLSFAIISWQAKQFSDNYRELRSQFIRAVGATQPADGAVVRIDPRADEAERAVFDQALKRGEGGATGAAVPVGDAARGIDASVALADDAAGSRPDAVGAGEDLAAATDGGTEADAPAKSWLGWTEFRRAWVDLRTGEGPSRFVKFRAELSGTALGYIIDSIDFDAAGKEIASWLANAGLTVGRLMINGVLVMTGLIIVIIYLMFLLLDFPEYSKEWKTFLPPKYRDEIVDFLNEFDVAMRVYFRGQFIVAALVGVGFAVGFTIIGLPMAVPLGLFVGALNLVPYLQWVALVPCFMLAAMKSIQDGGSLTWILVGLLAVFAVVQAIQEALIVPRVMGKVTGLRPVAILLGVFIWGKLLGFLGLILAIPLTCLGIAYYRRFVLEHSREESSFARKAAEMGEA